MTHANYFHQSSELMLSCKHLKSHQSVFFEVGQTEIMKLHPVHILYTLFKLEFAQKEGDAMGLIYQTNIKSAFEHRNHLTTGPTCDS